MGTSVTRKSRKIVDAPEFHELTRSIDTKVLQKLLLIWYNVFYDCKTNPSPLAKEIIVRTREEEPDVALTRRTLAYSFRPEDVMKMMSISKRQAIEYIKFFQIIYSNIPE